MANQYFLTIILVALVCVEAKKIWPVRPAFARCRGECRIETTAARLGFLNTTVNWFTQDVDHFSFAKPSGGVFTYQQRYLTYDGFYRKGGPIFFYTGNEGNVELYANATGLMWENAEDFGAYIVFAEHRYYGKSMPFGDKTMDHMEYLTSEQALADYAVLIRYLKVKLNAEDAAVIAFGGSYGGMLSSWFRMKYPGSVDGAIAASAPILAFADEDDAHPGKYWDSETYWKVVSRDASADGGATRQCSEHIRAAWPILFKAGESESGRKRLSETFRLCKPLENTMKAIELAEFIKYAFDTMAMGDFPFPSSYLTGGGALLPAFPVRAACERLESTFAKQSAVHKNWALLEALRDGAAVYTNITGDSCLQLPEDVEEDGIWDYQWCTEMQPQETYFGADGVNDMFWAEPFNFTFVKEHCEAKYGVTPRPGWIRAHYGGHVALKATSNIVFSNGLLDPWSAGGVRYNVSESVVAIEIPLGAHHLDLMFSDPNDPPCVINARKFHIEHVARWVEQVKKRND